MSKFIVPLFGATTTLAAGGATLVTPGLIGFGGLGSTLAAAGVPAALTSLPLGNILSGAGILMSAATAQQTGVAQQRSANLQAELLNREAAQRRQESEIRAGQFARQQSRMAASQRALLGGSGVRVGAGTPLDIQEDLADEIELQRRNILHGGFADEASLRAQSGFTRFAGKEARRAGTSRAGSILLSGAGKLFGT